MDQTNLCTAGIKSCKSICAPGTQTRNNAIISLIATHENKLLSHKTFEITEKYTCRAMFSQLSTPPAVLPCSQTGCLLLSPVTVVHRPHIWAPSWCSGHTTFRCLTHRCWSLCLPLQKEAAFAPSESHWCQKNPSCCLQWRREGRHRPRQKVWSSFPSKKSTYWHVCTLFTAMQSCSTGSKCPGCQVIL